MRIPGKLLTILILTILAQGTILVEFGFAQNSEKAWTVVHHPTQASLRGVCVADDQSIWASGSQGSVLRSIDQGKTWDELGPHETDKFDFRDVHAFDQSNAIVMAVGSPGRIYRTNNGGQSWKLVFEDTRPEIFLDAMSFWDESSGIAFGDAIDGRILILVTNDGGRSWSELEREKQPEALEGEGGFAASGTCLCIQGEKVFIGLGGERQQGDVQTARILVSGDRGETWEIRTTPILSGAASGIFSIDFLNDQVGVAVGGTYNNPDDRSSHIAVSVDGGLTWTRPPSSPGGYRSCVTIQPNGAGHGHSRILALGKTGADYSDDKGQSWHRLDDSGFYAVDSDGSGKVVVAVGAEGKIGVLSFD